MAMAVSRSRSTATLGVPVSDDGGHGGSQVPQKLACVIAEVALSPAMVLTKSRSTFRLISGVWDWTAMVVTKS